MKVCGLFVSLFGCYFFYLHTYLHRLSIYSDCFVFSTLTREYVIPADTIQCAFISSDVYLVVKYIQNGILYRRRFVGVRTGDSISLETCLNRILGERAR